MTNYDFFIAGRWQNKDNIKPVLDAVRARGKTAYCFIENEYTGETVEFSPNGNPETFMKQFDDMSQDDPFIYKVFETDMSAERAAENFVLILPAGINGNIEAGVAYGMGKKCYAIGTLEKTETLYCIFDEVFPDLNSFQEWLG